MMILEENKLGIKYFGWGAYNASFWSYREIKIFQQQRSFLKCISDRDSIDSMSGYTNQVGLL